MKNKLLVISILVFSLILVGCAKKLNISYDTESSKEEIEIFLKEYKLEINDVLLDNATETRLTDNKIYFNIDGNSSTYNLWLEQVFNNMKEVADKNKIYDTSDNLIDTPKDMFYLYEDDTKINIILGKVDNNYYIKIDKELVSNIFGKIVEEQ